MSRCRTFIGVCGPPFRSALRLQLVSRNTMNGLHVAGHRGLQHGGDRNRAGPERRCGRRLACTAHERCCDGSSRSSSSTSRCVHRRRCGTGPALEAHFEARPLAGTACFNTSNQLTMHVRDWWFLRESLETRNRPSGPTSNSSNSLLPESGTSTRSCDQRGDTPPQSVWLRETLHRSASVRVTGARRDPLR